MRDARRLQLGGNCIIAAANGKKSLEFHLRTPAHPDRTSQFRVAMSEKFRR
jgi:hypothetical protein